MFVRVLMFSFSRVWSGVFVCVRVLVRVRAIMCVGVCSCGSVCLCVFAQVHLCSCFRMFVRIFVFVRVCYNIIETDIRFVFDRKYDV